MLPADRSYVYSVARRIVGTHDDAEDVAQEALLLAHRHRERFRGDASYRTWLHRIATTAALTALRRRRAARRRADALGDHLVACGEVASGGPDTLLERARILARVAAQVEQLEDKYRRVLALRLDGELSDREIARALGLSVTAVKVRAFRARRLLRDQKAPRTPSAGTNGSSLNASRSVKS